MAKGSETGGCLNCYAARLSARNLPGMVSPTTGLPFARILQSGPRWTGKVELINKALDLPLRWNKPRRIFVNSLSDLFHEALPDETIDRVFAVMALCPQHTFQILTKRPERMVAYFGRSSRDYKERVYDRCYAMSAVWPRGFTSTWPLPNVWLGTSVENQTTADMRIPLLLQTPAAKRFLSYEPALGPVDFTRIEAVADSYEGRKLRKCGVRLDALTGKYFESGMVQPENLDWIIVGGESGPGARPFDIQWARNTIEQCKAAGVACFVKQLGAKPFYRSGHGLCYPDTADVDLNFCDRKGGDISEWTEDLRVREFPA